MVNEDFNNLKQSSVVLLEVDVNCSDNNNVNVEYLESPRVHVKKRI